MFVLVVLLLCVGVSFPFGYCVCVLYHISFVLVVLYVWKCWTHVWFMLRWICIDSSSSVLVLIMFCLLDCCGVAFVSAPFLFYICLCFWVSLLFTHPTKMATETERDGETKHGRDRDRNWNKGRHETKNGTNIGTQRIKSRGITELQHRNKTNRGKSRNMNRSGNEVQT